MKIVPRCILHTGQIYLIQIKICLLIFLLKTNLWFLILFRKQDHILANAVHYLSHIYFSESILNFCPSCAISTIYSTFHVQVYVISEPSHVLFLCLEHISFASS